MTTLINTIDSHAYMRALIVIKVIMALSAFSSFRVHTVRGTIRSAGCWGYPIYWANAYEC